MGFKAEDAVPKLEWDFTAYVSGAKGVSPEPSTDALLEFNLSMRALAEAELRVKKSMVLMETDKLNERSKEEKQAEVERWASLDFEGGSIEVLAELAQFVSVEEGVRLARRQAELVAKLLQDCPTADQIMGLPMRIRTAYMGWVAGQLMDPELGAADTKL